MCMCVCVFVGLSFVCLCFCWFAFCAFVDIVLVAPYGACFVCTSAWLLLSLCPFISLLCVRFVFLLVLLCFVVCGFLLGRLLFCFCVFVLSGLLICLLVYLSCCFCCFCCCCCCCFAVEVFFLAAFLDLLLFCFSGFFCFSALGTTTHIFLFTSVCLHVFMLI